MKRDDTVRTQTAVLFDLDGTIVDSRTGIIDSLHGTLRDLGHEPDPSHDLTWVVGPPLRDLIGEILNHYGDDRCDEAMAFYRARYEAEGMFRTPVFSGMREAIDVIGSHGRRLFIATSKPIHLARAILEQHGLLSRFEHVYGARPDDSGAEKPELIAAALHEQGLDKRRVVMIGDRRFDISGAHANGVRGLGVSWGYGGQTELEDAGAEGIVDHPDDLPAAVEQHLHAAGLHLHDA
ncbi:phosphoglycolate phosphatase [Acetobacter nitrogenifigens DSM 23921 = NBRC 105050]|uniref:Phosphoglycolate phosphatase n=1 Tax=Acetobacter nitrogenifigens DSM 23921 = NBRC 105050 TaxID=1120919 RepID=A0A511XDD8_9PROT|nr:HAD hydrolase-like protein [Acetobacter nitrogenifigens]GBQ90137.1 phosphoglycolate phosphatase [Acetobacter nitrogenifigens DSM 23921 = NBRC 105050]GEN60895.1 phosphoglycolate phosphatase [Acetobacter nitrogenifigens DSM 23921 = NBRC 105050]